MPREEYRGRYGMVYFSTEKELEKWEEVAKSRGVKFSTLAKEALNQLEEKKEARPDLIQKCSELEDRIAQLQTELRLKTTLLDRLEKDIFKFQHSRFEDPDPLQDGERQYSLHLIKLLQDGKVHDSAEIFSSLNIDPRDTEGCKLILNQITALTRHILITETSKGWRWL
jgi:hypothetical protein